MRTDRLARFAWLVLAYNVVVVLYGAVVRATGSGAGCGSHWPDCNGGALPLSGTAAEFIEFGHRASSGIALVSVAVLVAWVFRARPAGHPARKVVVGAGALIVTEALIGALLVMFEWVAEDQSTGRAVSITLHLVNTFLLLASLALTAWTASGGRVPQIRSGRRRFGMPGVAAIGLLVVGVAGAVTALGDTLFPSESLFEGIRDDFTGTFLVRLRWIHPIVAVAVSVFVVYLVQTRRPGSKAGTRLADGVSLLVVVQLAVGVVNVILLAPVWMQVVHLLLADLVWIGFVLYSAELLAEPADRRLAVAEAGP